MTGVQTCALPICGHYTQDVPFVNDYVNAAAATAADPEAPGLAAFLSAYCFESADHAAYLERVGLRRLHALREF